MVELEDIKEIVNATIDEYYQLDNKCSIIKSSPYYAQALEMSEKYGLRLKKCTRNQLRFEDTGHTNPLNDRIKSTEIRFDGMLDNPHIDFTNTEDNFEEGVWTMDTLLGYYDSTPENLKNRVGIIDFIGGDDPNHSTIYDPNMRKENVIYMTDDAFIGLTDYESDTHNPERIMMHEMGHCFEYGQLNSDDKTFIKKVYSGDPSVANEEAMAHFKEDILPKMHTYSNSDGVFTQAVVSEAEDIGEDIPVVIPSTYAKGYFYENSGMEDVRLSEHFAETVSMVGFRDKSDKSNAKIRTGSPLFAMLGLDESKDYDEYMTDSLGRQSESVPLVEDLIFNS